MDDGATGAIERFAGARKLSYSDGAELPRHGSLLEEDDLSFHGTATGKLPGGEEGTLARVSYTYRSDDTTHTVELTIAVTSVPESIGFAPYMKYSGGGHSGFSIDGPLEKFDVADDVEVRVAAGMDQAWLRELFSPSLSDWLARSPSDFAFELSEGVLCVSREQYLSLAEDLERLCEDAAHLAQALRTESVEEVETGGADETAAKTKVRDAHETGVVDRLVKDVPLGDAPADIAAAQAAYRDVLVRTPSTYLGGFARAVGWTLVINVIGGGIYGLLLNLPDPLKAIIVFQIILLVPLTFLCIRNLINRRAKAGAVEAFYRGYAEARGLEFEDPLAFSAAHAKAELPGKPDRVMTGSFDGADGSLVLVGDGLTRGDRIALVAGPSGPTATADFEVSAPGISAKALDDYAERLAAELAASRAP